MPVLFVSSGVLPIDPYPRRARACRALALAAFLLTGLACPIAGAHDKIGANLNFIGDFRRNHEFVDVVKQSRRFLKIGEFDDQQAAKLAPIGADGWPTTDFRVFAMAAQQNTAALAGTYKIVFTGQATLSTSDGGAGAIANQVHDAATNTTRADLVYPGGVENLIVNFTGTGGTVKDVRILRPGYNPTTAPLLHAPWKDHAQRFSILRFLDWTRTNGNRAVTWADRTTDQKLRTEAYIARWETVIDAANSMGRDAWINIPVQANDEYVTNLATLLRDRLSPSLNVYVEYGNELWNFSIRDVDMDIINGGTAFNGATVNRSLAAASPAGSPLRFDGSSDQNVLAFRRVALRLKEVSDIFSAVWGTAAINTRVRPVLAGQMGNSFIVTEGLRLVDEGLNIRPDTVFYALSGAPYIFAAAEPNGDADEASNMTAQQILSGLAAGVANAPADNAYQYLTHAGLGAWYGLKVVAYEAGFDSFGGQNVTAKRAANLDPAIRQTCKTYIDQWHSFGFEHLLWFNAGADSYNTTFGMWPLVEDLSLPNTPKNQCIDDVLASALPAVTAGTAITAPIAGGNFRGSTAPAGAVTGLAGPFGSPGFVEYLLRVDTAGSYDLVVRGSAPPGESLRLKLNNALVAASVALPASTGNSAALRVNLRRGLNAMRIERNGTGASWSVESFSFTLVAGAVPLTANPDTLAFGGQSMGTTSPPQSIVVTNNSASAVAISVVSVSGTQFTQTNNCGSLAPAASCAVTVRFSPAAAAGALNSTVAVTGTLSIASNAAGSPLTAALTGTAEKSLITHYYRSILRRAPDAGGKVFWQAEAARMQGLQANVNETWFSMAMEFYFGAEYGIFNRNNSEFVTDLYGTFFNRAPDSGGFAFWTQQLASGMPREGVLASFMFSPEFAIFTQAIFGNTAARSEINVVMDFYRGLLSRLPDTGGFNFYVQQFRTAQCQNAGAVYAQAEEISRGYATSPEYANRGRSSAQYVADLYNSFLRRGPDLSGLQFWIGQLNGGRSRESLRQEFKVSPEFDLRVNNIIGQGCFQ